MNTATLAGLAPTASPASRSADAKPATRDATTAANGDDRFERLLRGKEAARNPAVAAGTESTEGSAEAAAVSTKPKDADTPEPAQEQDEDTRDWPLAALALLGIPWTDAAQPAQPVALPETATGVAPTALPGGGGGAGSAPQAQALASAIDVLSAGIEGEPAPATAGIDATTGLPTEARPVDNTATTARSAENPLPSATQLAATAPAIAPEALPIAPTLKELTDTLRQDADGDSAAPTINAAAAPSPSTHGLPRTATVNLLAAPTPDLHSEHFDEAIGTRLTWMAEQKIGHAHIRMTPEQLGPVEIRLRLEGDRVHADFDSAQPEVRQALESSLPKLREMLGQHGFQLAHADVGHRQEAPARHPDARNHDGAPSAEGTDLRSPSPAPRHSVRGLLDAYA
ncbi:flagellar hook-length control protein FliK [Luteimonas cucumeris]|uniref:Flagellar hook-length control protein FliK n=1 Tax=Luteimonas cucumeris TaxID=985012 RepID=A0A562L5S7_9GAMM|nr:flagellar hook-length control protein FliK [Luteimonas cucumeris]TWI02794.1 flagellar hook-length control protein FliK [Luteimonas cucumeris]